MLISSQQLYLTSEIGQEIITIIKYYCLSPLPVDGDNYKCIDLRNTFHIIGKKNFT